MEKSRRRVRRSGIWLMLASIPLLGLGVVAAAVPASAAPDEGKKSYVCKYVGTPGEDERLQDGNNPIWVANRSLGVEETYVGQVFADDQGRSVVLVANTPKLDPEPTREDCEKPPAEPSPSPTPTPTPTEPEPSESPTPTPTPTEPEPSESPSVLPTEEAAPSPTPETSVLGVTIEASDSGELAATGGSNASVFFAVGLALMASGLALRLAAD